MSSIVLALCKQYGPLLNADGIDGRKLMWAIAGNESSFGKNTMPRYEPAYDIGGIYANQQPQNELLKAWGKQAAYSYGPWQMMPCNARGFTPQELDTDPEKAAQAFVGFFNRYIIGVHHASNFDKFCQCYNSGHWESNPAAGVERYVEDALHYYQTAEFQ